MIYRTLTGTTTGGFSPQMEINCNKGFCIRPRKCERLGHCREADDFMCDPSGVVQAPDYSDSDKPIRGYGTASKRRSRD